MLQFLSKGKISPAIIYTIFATVFVSIFVVSTFFTSFNVYLYVFCLGFASFFILKKPEAGLYTIIISTFIFEQFFTLQALVFGENVYKIYPLDILIIVTLISFVFHLLRSGQKIRLSQVGLGIIVFIIFCIISFAYGLATAGDFDTSFSTLKNYALYSILFFLVINIIRERVQVERLVKIFLFGGLALFFFIFYGIINKSGLWIEYTPLSTVGTRLLAPTHAFYLCIVVLILLNFLAYKKNYFGQLAVPIILIQILGVVGSLSRHLWLALAVGVLFSFFFLSKRNKKSLLKILAIQLFLVIIVISLYLWFDYIISGKLNTMVDEFIKSTAARLQSFSVFMEDESSTFRLLAWQEAWKSFKGSPLVGIGFGHKLTFDYFGYPVRIDIRELHNNFVGIALQMGLLGFTAFGAANILFCRQAYKIFKKSAKQFRPYILSFFACYILFLVCANFGTYFDINLLVIFFWIFLGVVVATGNISEADKVK